MMQARVWPPFVAQQHASIFLTFVLKLRAAESILLV